jgi:hypothetical protein
VTGPFDAGITSKPFARSQLLLMHLEKVGASGTTSHISFKALTLRLGEWRGGNKFTLGHDPRGKLLGILGMGGIGHVSPSSLQILPSSYLS